ncbi:AMP-binding protein [Kineobactrum salinum]|uniref:AMP-binding protein n=1 Tax=Kineobactrum salinum TaxID=2708301 RepID=UPI0022B2A689|nr:AMP-binding protein [Kineobactrum salinum]
MASVYQTFATTARRAADNAFLHIPASAAKSYSATAVDLSYAQALQRIDQCAASYSARGYGSPQRVALVLENRADFFIHWLALNSLGCSVIPVSREMQDEEIAYYLEHGEACLLVAIPEALAQLQPICNSLQALVPLVDCQQLDTLPPAPTRRDGLQPSATTECALLYTSGSTGKPKGCILSNEYFTFAGEWYLGLGGLTQLRDGEERLLTPLPLTHMNAMAVSSMAMIMSAGCLIQLDRFHPREWWSTVHASGATIVHYLGVLPAMLLELPPGNTMTAAGGCALASAPASTPNITPCSNSASAFR